MKLNYDLKTRDEKVVLPENLLFGRTIADHCFEMDYDPEKGGWINPTIRKYENIQLSPASMALHYGQEIFEGLKAYKHDDGRIAMFRPEKNFERMNRSAERLCMPTIDVNFMVEALKELVKIEQDWIPKREGHSLYIRPVMFATDPFLGVRPSNTYKLMIILSPVGPYYPEGFKPVKIMVTDQFVRAVRKGVGECKTAGNYAAGLLGQKLAKDQGYSQVLWLDGIHQKYLEEVGTMNIFVQFKDEVATPSLSGTILPGVTRMSALQILRDWGYTVNERNIHIDEVLEGYGNRNLVELFGTGTAAVISAVGKLKYNDYTMNFSEEEPGELSKKLYKELTGIQFGLVEDRYNWLTYLD